MTQLNLPREDRSIELYTLSGTPIALEKRSAADFNRIAFAAAHVVADPFADNDPWLTPAIDWDATLRFRHRLWDLGLGVAEAMDTAQRGMGLAWPQAQELISRALKEAATRQDALIACGVGTDHLTGTGYSLDQIVDAYQEQLDFVQGEGGRVILMASRALAASAKSPDDYLETYARVLAQAKEKVVIHWLGEMFDPALEGYWGASDHMAAMDTCLDMLKANADKIDGIKISLLSKEKEITMRRRLPAGVRMYTGDDFNYAELIAGDEHGHSDALLGIFDAIAPAASKALASLKSGANNEFFDILEPTVALSRHIFKAPTRFYKTGVVFLAYLNGLQEHFTMIGGQESTRSTLHLAELFRLADKANVLADPDDAARRMKAILSVRGVH
ncbi:MULTISPECIES: dihydrodipicolinate synthase family protein [Agrobacterium]|uniref:Dihydrodipicolinate synthase family protein n=1 Tax=Agrobacterium rosae TaxID=1972867 RepID=A0A1R3TNS0_9HYPH|nr:MULTISPECIES: dihydrodipicolinate synthase family protein [Agrobacterium]KAA3511674.1 dihydrodipicolinate synthase family protein [Agrobacterium rosae]KAA3518904.1 dihydrodipicolinate synthase family protein [Agrobacterium rosae]MBN7806726.1 dihydrodipicolinate synthase family protein [Agrobacterium rosae]MCM2435144.1 dihydrodipicolinate synthase family protein [Agrobacterium rosae]MDX8314218.1 dihydrodipicolinate synthase family protein [Agrobacterium rosae]